MYKGDLPVQGVGNGTWTNAEFLQSGLGCSSYRLGNTQRNLYTKWMTVPNKNLQDQA